MEKVEPLLREPKAIPQEWETIQDAGTDLFFTVVEKKAYCVDDQGCWCYWCGEKAYFGKDLHHKDDCMWVRVQKLANYLAVG